MFYLFFFLSKCKLSFFLLRFEFEVQVKKKKKTFYLGKNATYEVHKLANKYR